ncbi:MAG: pyridoxal phosphate-dependent aminotransferase [Acidobacteria bacterium]|nr:MAG: pyridoxal phosphate-dependent aminotransferase [Acidobacteriota bacterium]
MTTLVSQRAREIKPFLVMEVLEAAQCLERNGVDVVHMEVGEPGFETPAPIRQAAITAMQAGETHYTHSRGVRRLRIAIAEWHRRKYRTEIDPDCVVVVSGTSPAMLLVFMALCETGSEIIIADPCYACYPQLITFAGGVPVTVRTTAQTGFHPDREAISRAITSRTRAVLINSPSNPCGTVIDPAELARLAELGLFVVSDEIYHGLVYGERAHSIREYTDHSAVVNGFSKLYAMTGWRLGYLIAPPDVVRAVQKMQQNFFISACHFAQTAAITALSEECDSYVQEMIDEYGRRRDLVIAGLERIGIAVASEPRGAFYVFADVRRHCERVKCSSYQLAFDILNQAHVAVTPGSDFGPGGEGYLRLSYAAEYERLEEGLQRLGKYFG